VTNSRRRALERIGKTASTGRSPLGQEWCKGQKWYAGPVAAHLLYAEQTTH
jgi:hypothetical protein